MTADAPSGARSAAASSGDADRPDDSPARDRRLRIATVIGVLAIGALGLASGDTVLRGAVAWFAFVMCVLSGWGYLVVRIARVADVDFGLRAAWGIAGYLAVAGILVAAGIATRPVILALAGIGAAGFAWRELAAPRASWHAARDGLQWMRGHRRLAVVATVLACIALVHILGAISALDRNPWDDDLAYTPMVRRLLDAGDLVEPFSFRRLGSYGGQSALQALVAARGSLANIHLFDRGICFALVLLLVVGGARERSASFWWLALLLLVIEVMPNTAINTASYWSGAALFLALYRTLASGRAASAKRAPALPDDSLELDVPLAAMVSVMRQASEPRASIAHPITSVLRNPGDPGRSLAPSDSFSEMRSDAAMPTVAAHSSPEMRDAAEPSASSARAAIIGLVGAATCTLRQSYLPIVVVFVGVALLCELAARARASGWRAAWAGERRSWAIIAGIAIVALAGWWIAMVRSSDTFLFPLIGGTFNDAVALRPTGVSWAGELGFLAWCCAEPAPIVVVAPLCIVLLVGRDRRPGKPLVALFAATVVGFLALVHAFAGYEAHQLWRYTFGPGLALLAALVLDHGDDHPSEHRADAHTSFALPALARWLLLVALAVQLVASRRAALEQLSAAVADLRNAAAIDRDGDRAVDATRARYAALQANIPAGATVAVMLDEPYYLDFARNRIANLDTPGYASPTPHLPAFNGPGALHWYLVEHGIRYVAFVRSDASRYFYRRPFWVWRLFGDAEPFQVMSAYTIDMIDTFAALAETTKVLRDADGMVVLDLGGGADSVLHRPGDEPTRRYAFVHALADREGLHAAWSLSPRADVIFQDGFAGLAVNGAPDTDPTPAREDTIRSGTLVRTTNRRAHLRIRGAGDHRLHLRGHVAVPLVPTRPHLDIALDGDLLASTAADEFGGFLVDIIVPGDLLGNDWHDLTLVWSGAIDPKKESRDPRVARLEGVEWEKR